MIKSDKVDLIKCGSKMLTMGIFAKSTSTVVGIITCNNA